MQHISNSSAESICTHIAAATSDQLLWQWDGRFNTALAQFNVSEVGSIHQILERHLTISWPYGEIESAPERVRSILAKLGGLQRGQMFLTSDPENSDEFVYCAWWPWGNGEKVSIRLASSGYTENCCSDPDHHSRIKSWFGISKG